MVPSLPGCVTYGETIDEAKKMAIDAIGAYIASLKKHQETVPIDEESLLFSSIEVKQHSLSHA